MIVATTNSQGFPWLAEVFGLLLGIIALWTSFRTWRGLSPWRNELVGLNDPRSLRVAASTFPSAIFFLSLSLALPMAYWVNSSDYWLAIASQVFFVLFMMICAGSFSFIIYIFVRKVPKFLVPPPRRPGS